MGRGYGRVDAPPRRGYAERPGPSAHSLQNAEIAVEARKLESVWDFASSTNPYSDPKGEHLRWRPVNHPLSHFVGNVV